MDKIKLWISALLLTIIVFAMIFAVIGTIMFCINVISANTVTTAECASFFFVFSFVLFLAWFCIKKD